MISRYTRIPREQNLLTIDSTINYIYNLGLFQEIDTNAGFLKRTQIIQISFYLPNNHPS